MPTPPLPWVPSYISKDSSLYLHFLFSFFKHLFIFNCRIITLQYCVDFRHTSAWISCRYTYVTSLPPPIPSHCHRALDFSLRHTENPHWLSILHMVMYMFHCYFLNSFHPLLPPLFFMFPSPLLACSWVPQWLFPLKASFRVGCWLALYVCVQMTPRFGSPGHGGGLLPSV